MADNRRAHIRYTPDHNSLVTLRRQDGEENLELVGLLRDRSEGGCAAVFQEGIIALRKNETYEVKINQDEFHPAFLVWSKKMDKQFIKAGFEYEKE